MKVNKEEIFEIVDEQGNVIGTASRSMCHKDPTLLHRVAHILVFKTNGSLVLQKRALNKDTQPGKWDSSVGGHFDLGETPERAATREMFEELGLKNQKLEFLHSYICRNTNESELVYTFKVTTDDEIKYSEQEIDYVKEWTTLEIQASIGKAVFTPNFEYEFELFYKNINKNN